MFCYFCRVQNLLLIMNTTFSINIPIDERETLLLPSFTLNHTLAGPKREPLWLRAKEAVEDLRKKSVNTTTQTLFNMYRRGDLHPRVNSPRNIQFDLYEVFIKFNIKI